MATSNHTYGAKCRLAPVVHADREDDMPPVEAQFFYSSIIPIDDPLSTSSVPTPADNRPGRGQLRPFSSGDNNFLEKAWLSLVSDADHCAHEAILQEPVANLQLSQRDGKKLGLLIHDITSRHWERHQTVMQKRDGAVHVFDTSLTTPVLTCCPDLAVDVSQELARSFCALVRQQSSALDLDEVVQQVALAIEKRRQGAKKTAEARPGSSEASHSRPGSAARARAGSAPSPRLPSSVLSPQSQSSKDNVAHSPRETETNRREAISSSHRTNAPARVKTPTGSPAGSRFYLDDGLTGKPFIRVGNLESQADSPATAPSRTSELAQHIRRSEESEVEAMNQGGFDDKDAIVETEDKTYRPEEVEVAVGVSRLHMVSLPLLQMKPIYWSPVNDVAVVTRATWFYRDTMLPIPSAVANRLEAGYQELRPWTQTWSDEIRCAIDVGPVGEEKVSQRLWPKATDSPPGEEDLLAEGAVSSDPYCAAHCFRGEAATEGVVEWHPIWAATQQETATRAFSSYHVVYKNANDAFLLKPSLKPSAYYGRRPVSKIMKGVTVGIPVVRGFDRPAWERIHHKKQVPSKPGISAARESHENRGPGVCSACKVEKEQGQVSDLVLVAHGIGQKFAERVESFHFTHAINGFRRAVNMELKSDLVQRVLREDQNGLMILPLNWRSGLSFEDGGPMREEDKTDYTTEGFALKDIEPDSIPAVRSMISDVMFDIPFYMSHHKGKMINALVSEANRVYRLWCRNNPGFADNGRVHLIGHSLGSAMALEILSRQPTAVPRMDLSLKSPETRFFEFDTKNLFLAGSPAGFFLLLEKGMLIPRRGRMKPGADSGDTVATDIVGEAGKFGCLAVDNIYNILAKEDPIAYLLNGSVDPTYAASLKQAYVPSIASSLWKSVTGAMRSVVPGAPGAADPLAPEPERPPTLRLPSQLELEVHDFTREEIAEKKFLLLNDNGQIDWYLPSGGGPLEIQYLNMLGAHSSYWTNQDFIRMLCIEIGRKPGRAHTVPAMRAVKAAKRLLV